MKKGVDLIFKLNGKIDDGIAVFELSPILLSVGTLVKEAHKTLYPNDRDLSISIKPFEKGSFDINILLSAKSVLDQFLDFFNSETGRNITAVLTYIGLISQYSGANIVNLIQVISFIKGKLKFSAPLESGEVKYIAEDNTSIIVPGEVHTLYNNCNIQQHFYTAIGRPLENPDVDSLDTFLKNKEKETMVSLDKNIAPSIKAYSTQQPILSPEELIENKRDIWVRPKRVSLEGEKDHWSFRIGEKTIITAKITDENFLEKIREGSIRLSNIDRLLVELVEKQTVKEGTLSTSNEITKVKEYKKAPEQDSLEFT